MDDIVKTIALASAIMVALSWAFVQGIHREEHRERVACRIEQQQGYPVRCAP